MSFVHVSTNIAEMREMMHAYEEKKIKVDGLFDDTDKLKLIYCFSWKGG